MVGQNIGKYRVIDRVGRGGMGTVFRAVDETLSREVAIKILNAELNDPEVARRFRAEAVTVARLNHPGIATIYELFQHDGQWLMVMEFVRGETLEHMVERLGPLSPQRAADLCMQSLAALSHAHRMGVVHRDLKPANLMITESGAVKIMDFGIARVAGSEHLTSAGFLMGTPAYMAPEQVTGGEIDARTDLYALGVVFYYLVTARLPFKGDTPIAIAQSRVNSMPTPVNSVREGLPTWIGPLIDRSLSKAPADRFQSAEQFRESLRRGLAGLPMETLSGGTIPPELVATTPPGVLRSPTSTSGSIPSSSPSGVSSMAVKTPTAANEALAPPGQPDAPSAKAPTTVPPAKPFGRRAGDAPKSSGGPSPAVLALGGAVMVLAALVGWMLLRSHQTRPSTAVTTTAAATPASTPTTTPTPDPNANTPPVTLSSPAATSPTTSPGATTSTSGAVPPAPGTSPNRSGDVGATLSPNPTPGTSHAGAPGAAGTSAAGAPGATPAPSPGAGRSTIPAPAGARGPGLADDPISFSDVKYFHITGTKGDDEDANLQFGNGQILITPRKTGSALATQPYRSVAHATYVRAKNPKWDQGLPGPDPGLDVSNLFRNTRHWLVLQTRSDFIVLRLDDSDFQSILDMFETRTGLKIDRPPAGDK